MEQLNILLTQNLWVLSQDDGRFYARKHTHVRAADGHWAAEPLKQQVALVRVLASAIIFPTICRF